MLVPVPVEHPRGRRRRRSWVLDVLVACVAAAVSLHLVFLGDIDVPRGLRVAYLLGLCVPLVFRRLHPVPVFAWVLGLTFAAALWELRLGGAAAPALVALYTLVSSSPRRTGLVAAGLAEVCVVLVALPPRHPSYRSALIPLTALVAAALGLGLYYGARRALLAELRERAARLERERDQQGELAAAAERTRIAREIHDVVAHHLTVMVALSDGACAASASDPVRAAEAMRAVSATGRQALSDTRRLLGVLREPITEEAPGPVPDADGAARQPVPGLADLDPLLDRVRAAGLPVTYELRGSTGGLPTPVQATLYRLVQEALTNTLKHGGPGARAGVRLEHRGDEVLLEVTDDGAGDSAPVPAGVGRGLAGMRERVHAFAGEVQTGPRATGGWQVRARLRTRGEDQ